MNITNLFFYFILSFSVVLFFIFINCFVSIITERNPIILYDKTKEKVKNSKRLQPLKLKRAVNKILKLKNASNVTIARHHPNYTFLMKDGNPFNFPRNVRTIGLEITKNFIKEKEKEKGKKKNKNKKKKEKMSSSSSPLTHKNEDKMEKLLILRNYILSNKNNNIIINNNADLSRGDGGNSDDIMDDFDGDDDDDDGDDPFSKFKRKRASRCTKKPIEISLKNADDSDCVLFCKSKRAFLINNVNGIFNNTLLDDKKKYCFVSNNNNNNISTPPPFPKRDKKGVRCSTVAGLLVFDGVSKWKCHCRYPNYFSGSRCTTNVACRFDPHKFRRNPVWKYDNYLVDGGNNNNDDREQQQHPILTHEDLRNAQFLQKLDKASVSEYIDMINDPNYFLNNMLFCKCSGLDVHGNRMLDIRRENLPSIYHMNPGGKCFINPCKLTRIDDTQVTYNINDYTCHPNHRQNYNALLGDESTPFAGSAPLIGLRPKANNNNNKMVPLPTSNSVKKHKTTIHHDNGGDHNFSYLPYSWISNLRNTATSIISPIVLPPNQNHTNTTRVVLYFPVDQINFPLEMNAAMLSDNGSSNSISGNDNSALSDIDNSSSSRHAPIIRAPSIYELFGDTLPSPTFGSLPSQTAFYVHPVENVLGNYQPQNPIDFDLLINQALENSRLISGNVIGGHETLMHTLFNDFYEKGASSDNPKIKNMLRLFEKTRLLNENTAVMTSTRISKATLVSSNNQKNTKNPFFRNRSILCLDQKISNEEESKTIIPEYSSFLGTAAFFRRYRTYASLAGLRDVENSFNTFHLKNTNSKKGNFNQLVAPTSLYHWNLEENDTYSEVVNKIANRIRIKVATDARKGKEEEKEEKKSICKLTRAKRIDDVEHNQLVDFWFDESESSRSLEMGLAYKYSLKDIDLANLKMRPVILHNTLINPRPNINDSEEMENSSTNYLYRCTQNILSSMWWHNIFDVDRFKLSYHLTDEDPPPPAES